MDPTRLRGGELLSGAAALALFITLFFDWNRDLRGNTQPAPLASFGTVSGWGSLGAVVVFLLVVVILLAAALVVATARGRPAAFPIGAAVLTTTVGLLTWLVVATRILTLDDSLIAAYVGLLLLLLVVVGSWISMADERKGSAHAKAPDLPRRPAPPAEG